MADGVEVLLLTRAGATVENEEDGLVLLGTNSGLDVSLVLAEKLRVQLDVAGLVHAVNVTEASGNGEVRGDGGESVVNVEDILRLSVEGVVVNILVVDTILLATSDTNLHLEPLLHGGSTLQVLGSGLNVEVDGLLRKIDHVRREQGLAVLLEVSLISLEHAIEPRQKLLSTVVGVEDDGDAVGGSDGADIVGTGDGTGNGSSLVAIGNTLQTMIVNAVIFLMIRVTSMTYLAGEVSSTTLRELKDDRGLVVAGSLERSNDSGGRSAVLLRRVSKKLVKGRMRRSTYNGRDGELLLTSVLEKLQDVITVDDTSLAAENILSTHCCGLWLCMYLGKWEEE